MRNFFLGNAITALMVIVLTSCAATHQQGHTLSQGAVSPGAVSQQYFGTLPNGETVTQYVMRNANGMEVSIITFGGIITSLKVPDKNGVIGDVVLGYDSLQPYVDDQYYLGALIGRYGNRIGGATFTLDGKSYSLDANDGKNHLHGGYQGFNKKNWHATAFQKGKTLGVKMQLLSKDGDQKYPGNLTVEVVYTLTDDNVLDIAYQAITDAPTVVNLTQHSYFNLATSGTILDHELTIPAANITPVDKSLIPTGDLLPVAGSPFDFTSPVAIGARIEHEHPQLHYGLGYDHNFILDKSAPSALELGARLTDPSSGRVLEIFTEEPAIQFYSGNFLDGTKMGKSGTLNYRTGLCLEPQHSPDSPNLPDFPSTVLRPGEVYSTKMSYRFSTL